MINNYKDNKINKQKTKGLRAPKASSSTGILTIGAFVSVAVFLCAAGVLLWYIVNYYRSEAVYQKLRRKYTSEIQLDHPEESTMSLSENIADTELVIDFENLSRINQNCIGWIRGCEDAIDYPIVYSEDNQFYLNHGFDGAKNRMGAIFADQMTEDAFSQFQTILYGHNMKNGSMFHALTEYKKSAYYKENPYFTIYTPEGMKTYEIFSAYNCSAADFYTILTEDVTKEQYLYTIYEKSIYDTNVTVTTEDHILTLVTCEYSGDEYRMIVHAKEI